MRMHNLACAHLQSELKHRRSSPSLCAGGDRHANLQHDFVSVSFRSLRKMLLVTARRLQRSGSSNKVPEFSQFYRSVPHDKGRLFLKVFLFYFFPPHACQVHGNLLVQVPLPIILSNISAQYRIKTNCANIISNPGKKEKKVQLFVLNMTALLFFFVFFCNVYAKTHSAPVNQFFVSTPSALSFSLGL